MATRGNFLQATRANDKKNASEDAETPWHFDQPCHGFEKGACAAAIKANNAKVGAEAIYQAECCYSVCMAL